MTDPALIERLRLALPPLLHADLDALVDAVQQPLLAELKRIDDFHGLETKALREQVGYWKHQADRWQVIAKEKTEACMALRERIEELEKADESSIAALRMADKTADTLRARVAELEKERQETQEYTDRRWAFAVAMTDKQRAEVEALRRDLGAEKSVGKFETDDLQKQVAALQNENEVLGKTLRHRQERYAALQNERERLRAALETVATLAIDYELAPKTTCGQMERVARAALAPLEADVFGQPMRPQKPLGMGPWEPPEAPLEGSRETPQAQPPSGGAG